jgi:hypothetical protein
MKKACHACIVKRMDPTKGFERIWGAFVVNESECQYCAEKLKSICAKHAADLKTIRFGEKYNLNSKECFKCKERK